MGVPKHRQTHSRTNKRRSHHALKKPNVITCTNCGEPTIAHRACASCGFYKGRQVLPIVEK